VRVLLFTGKGGVGKTSAAAATALRAARSGLRTLVMSTDPAHSLADALDVPLGGEPTPVVGCLEGQQIDARARLEDNWRQIQSYLVALLHWGGVDEVEAEELSVLPGLEEIFSLIDVRRHVAAGRHDLLVVDCAPTAETLRLLSLPDALGWYLNRLFPAHRRLAAAVRPALGKVTTMPLPADRVLGAVADLASTLDRVRAILVDQDTTSVRLVVNPEALVVAEARRTATYLSLFGYHVDAVVVNRVLPDAVTDPFFDRWRERQAGHLRAVEQGFGGAPVLRVPLFDDEPVGEEALQRLGDALYRGVDLAAVLHRGEPLRVERCAGDLVLSLALPHASKGELDTYRRGDELSVRVGAYARTLTLPAALARGEVAGAELRDGRLAIRFAVPSAPSAPTATGKARR
jgi:arsenite-transporting ATPase